jgi:hypothetical protein
LIEIELPQSDRAKETATAPRIITPGMGALIDYLINLFN